jgi:putative glutamine amidotransferase
MPKPVIGVTPTQSLDKMKIEIGEAYLRSIQRAGGLPITIPRTISEAELEEYFPLFDGVLFSGGGDIEVSRFDGEDHPSVARVDHERDELELQLVKMAVNRGLPFLGICRGMQVINVSLGGTLYTDLDTHFPNAIPHQYFPEWPRDHLAHTVRITEDGRLAQLTQESSLMVNSLHHQGINIIGSGLQPTAFSPDGLVEAVELPGHSFGIGVQWHPECLPDAKHAHLLFQGFVQAVSENRTAEN